MTDTIASWRTEVAYCVPGVSTTESDAAVLRAALDFCAYTKIWTERLFPMDIVVIEAASDIEFVDDAPAAITVVPISSGTSDGTTADKLVDSTADFVTDGIAADDVVQNLTDNTWTTVSAVDSLTTLSLADDYFTTGEDYRIYTGTLRTQTNFTTYFAAGDIVVTNHHSSEDDEKDNTGPFLIGTSGAQADAIVLTTGEVVVGDTDVGTIYISKAVYALTSSNGDIIEAIHVKLDGQVLTPKGEVWLDENIENWRIAMGSPEFFTVDREKKLRLIPVPNKLMYHALEVWVALKPLRAATTFPDFILDDWFETITDGAVARLLSQTSKPWRDFEAAGFYWERYASAREDARTRSRLGHSEARSRMTA